MSSMTKTQPHPLKRPHSIIAPSKGETEPQKLHVRCVEPTMSGRKPEGRKANWRREWDVVGKKLKLGSKRHGANAEEGGGYKCNDGRDFAHLGWSEGKKVSI